MDVTTQIRLLWLGGLGALYGVALGIVWLLDGWQHRRERRRSRLLKACVGSSRHAGGIQDEGPSSVKVGEGCSWQASHQ